MIFFNKMTGYIWQEKQPNQERNMVYDLLHQVMLVLLRLESLSGKCTKLHTVAASNNRVHLTRSFSSSSLATTINCSLGSQALLEVTHQDHSIGITLLLLVHATCIWVLFSTHIPFVVNRAFNANWKVATVLFKILVSNFTLNYEESGPSPLV